MDVVDPDSPEGPGVKNFPYLDLVHVLLRCYGLVQFFACQSVLSWELVLHLHHQWYLSDCFTQKYDIHICPLSLPT